MKKAILLCGMLLALTATVASAAGVNLNWGACYGDGPVTGNRNFACNTNVGSNPMVASYVLPHDVLAVSGNEIVVDLAASAPTLPAWWQLFTAGNCRAGASLTGNVIYGGPGVGCTDYWAGAGAGGVAAYKIGLYGPNTGRMILAFAVPASSISSQAGGVEYFSCNIGVTNAKTVGSTGCAGCQTQVCLVLNSIKVTTPTPLAGTDVVLTGGADAANSNFITWQGATVNPTTNLGTGCPAATPTHNATWGSVKALYR